MSWNTLRQTLLEKKLSSAGWQSDQKHLLEIVDRAMAWKIDERFSSPNLSNLRTVIRPAREALEREDPARLAELLEWAATLTVKDLRLKLDIPKLEQIEADRQLHGDEYLYTLVLTESQFELIQKKTCLNLEFKILG